MHQLLQWMKLKIEHAWQHGMKVTAFVFPACEETLFLKMLVNVDPKTWEVQNGMVTVFGVLVRFTKKLHEGRWLLLLTKESV